MTDKEKASNKTTKGICPGFSGRFNLFLDEAGYPEMNLGRLKVLAEDQEMSISGTRKWVVEDTPPKGAKLIEACETIINKKMNSKHNPKRIACWLEYGDDIIANPFNDGKSIANDHAIMGNLYVLVHNIAAEFKIDIYSMDSSLMEPVYETLMDDVVNNDYRDPDPKLISSLLILAEKKAKEK